MSIAQPHAKHRMHSYHHYASQPLLCPATGIHDPLFLAEIDENVEVPLYPLSSTTVTTITSAAAATVPPPPPPLPPSRRHSKRGGRADSGGNGNGGKGLHYASTWPLCAAESRGHSLCASRTAEGTARLPVRPLLAPDGGQGIVVKGGRDSRIRALPNRSATATTAVDATAPTIHPSIAKTQAAAVVVGGGAVVSDEACCCLCCYGRGDEDEDDDVKASVWRLSAPPSPLRSGARTMIESEAAPAAVVVAGDRVGVHDTSTGFPLPGDVRHHGVNARRVATPAVPRVGESSCSCRCCRRRLNGDVAAASLTDSASLPWCNAASRGARGAEHTSVHRPYGGSVGCDGGAAADTFNNHNSKADGDDGGDDDVGGRLPLSPPWLSLRGAHDAPSPGSEATSRSDGDDSTGEKDSDDDNAQARLTAASFISLLLRTPLQGTATANKDSVTSATPPATAAKEALGVAATSLPEPPCTPAGITADASSGTDSSVDGLAAQQVEAVSPRLPSSPPPPPSLQLPDAAVRCSPALSIRVFHTQLAVLLLLPVHRLWALRSCSTLSFPASPSHRHSRTPRGVFSGLVVADGVSMFSPYLSATGSSVHDNATVLKTTTTTSASPASALAAERLYSAVSGRVRPAPLPGALAQAWRGVAWRQLRAQLHFERAVQSPRVDLHHLLDLLPPLPDETEEAEERESDDDGGSAVANTQGGCAAPVVVALADASLSWQDATYRTPPPPPQSPPTPATPSRDVAAAPSALSPLRAAWSPVRPPSHGRHYRVSHDAGAVMAGENEGEASVETESDDSFSAASLWAAEQLCLRDDAMAGTD